MEESATDFTDCAAERPRVVPPPAMARCVAVAAAFRDAGARRRRLRVIVLWILLGALIFAGLFSLTVGPMDLSLGKVSRVLAENAGITGGSGTVTAAENVVVRDIRLARVLLAVFAGAGLAMSGAAMQGVFRNPLADPGIIGVSGGGAIGAIVMIVFGSRALPAVWSGTLALYAVPVSAMAGAIAMTWLIYRLSIRGGQIDLTSMLLVGIAINALGGAFIGLVSFVATAEELQSLTFWGLGSLARASWKLLAPAALFVVAPLFFFPRFSRSLNALALGEEDASHLGVDVRRVKRNLIALSAAVVGATVALCGGIGFIALVSPHIVRSAIGADNRFLLPASGLLGALLLLGADMAARTIAAPAELPIGVLTALFGAPVFLSLIVKRNRSLG